MAIIIALVMEYLTIKSRYIIFAITIEVRKNLINHAEFDDPSVNAVTLCCKLSYNSSGAVFKVDRRLRTQFRKTRYSLQLFVCGNSLRSALSL